MKTIPATRLLLACLVPFMVLLLPSIVHADRAAIVVHGSKPGELDTVMVSSSEIIAREGWELVEHKLPPERVGDLLSCLKTGLSCLGPVLDELGADRLIVLELSTESYKKVPARVVRGRLFRRGEMLSSSQRFCEQCRKDLLADSARSLLVELVRNAKMTIKPTTLIVRSVPAGALVKVDGEILGPTEIQRTLTPGAHSLVVEASGHEQHAEEIKLADGQRLEVDVKLVPIGGTVERPQPPHLPPVSSGRRFRSAQWGMIGGGVAALGGGLVASYLIGRASVPDAPEPLRESYHSTPALVVAGLGGAAAIGGMVWLLTSRDSDAPDTSGRAISISPTSAHAGWTFTF